MTEPLLIDFIMVNVYSYRVYQLAELIRSSSIDNLSDLLKLSSKSQTLLSLTSFTALIIKEENDYHRI